MENATKALLISAAVLIVIVLIALAVMLLKNSSGTTEQANEVGKEISHATEQAISQIPKLYITLDEFIEFINEKNENRSENVYNVIKEIRQKIVQIEGNEKPSLVVEVYKQTGRLWHSKTELIGEFNNDNIDQLNSSNYSNLYMHWYRIDLEEDNGLEVLVTIKYGTSPAMR